MDEPATSKAPASSSEPSVTITTPANPGDNFTGTAGGDYSPDGYTVTCGFWRSPPGPSDPPDVAGSVTMNNGVWSATFTMTGVPALSTGFLRATYETAKATKRNLVWTPPT